MEITVTVDRIEGDTAVIEVEDRMVDWPLSALPQGVKEGSTLRLVFYENPTDYSEQLDRLDRLRGTYGEETEEIDL